MAGPLVARVTKASPGYAKGAEFGFERESDAKRVLGEGNYTIVRHQDGEPYEAPRRVQPAAAADDSPRERKG